VNQFRSVYFSNRTFLGIGLCVVGFIFAFILPILLPFAKLAFVCLFSLMAADMLLLYSGKQTLSMDRNIPERLSNGDGNTISITVQSFFMSTVSLVVIDEIPFQFQERNVEFTCMLKPREASTITYSLRPVKRGEYSFGKTNAFVKSRLGLVKRRIQLDQTAMVPVYPSFIQMRKFELLAISNQLINSGIKRIRRIGQNQEFELIKKYVAGDDSRTVNWKASARRGELMVNHFQDERSQQVYSLIDKGRLMQMPFDGMSLLDYAINACLVISNIAIKKSDKAGLITFQDKIGTVLQASRVNNQVSQILETLYNQKTAYREPDFSVLYSAVRKNISQRSLLLVFTNFETLHGLHRQLPYLKKLSRYHLVVVIFFENTELNQLIDQNTHSLQALFKQAVAERFSFDKKLIVKELKKNGIHSVLTSPQNLTVGTINKYLELKARNLL
jgi:uncharacterized protein (DUF58 family)